MKKRLIIIGIILVAGIIGYNVISRQQQSAPTAPDIQAAPWVVTTSSRVYYVVQEPVKQGANIVIDDYYELANGEYVYRHGYLILTPKFGKVEVRKR